MSPNSLSSPCSMFTSHFPSEPFTPFSRHCRAHIGCRLSILSQYQHREPTLEMLKGQVKELTDAHAKHLDTLYAQQAREVIRAQGDQRMMYDPLQFTTKPKRDDAEVYEKAVTVRPNKSSYACTFI